MDIQKLQRVVIDALENVKAQDIKIFDTTHLTSLFDRVVIASATSNRHTRALAASVAARAREQGHRVQAMEGEETGEWVLVDLGDLIVHIMQPGIRTYYNLEELWGAKPVALKPAETSKSTPGVNKPAAKKAPAKKAPAKKAPAKKTTASKTATRSASKTSAKKSACAEIGRRPTRRAQKPGGREKTDRQAVLSDL